jgi:hypothetical protein
MPVSGPGSRPLPNLGSTISATGPTAATPAAAPQATAPVTQGWAAPQAGAPAAPPQLAAADVQASLPNPVRQAMQASVDKLTGRLETTLNQDAMSIARGKTPVREGDPLSAQQQTDLQSAAQDFVKEMPIGAFAPDVAAAIQDQLKAAGIDTRDIASTKLGDLGGVGGDIAKGLIKDLKTDSPTAYYSLAATGAAAIGYTAWNDGSAKLSRLGVKPEVKQKFFDDKLEVNLKGDWQSHFKDFKASGSVTGKMNVGKDGQLSATVSGNSRTGFESATVSGHTKVGGNTDVSGSVTANAQGFQSATVSASTDLGATKLSGTATANAQGFSQGRLDLSYHSDDLKLSAYGTANANGLESAGGRVEYQPSDDFKLSAGVDHNFQTGRTTASAEADWKVRDNVDFALSAAHDSTGDSRVGVGVRISF